jgi:hypothetical protein
MRAYSLRFYCWGQLPALAALGRVVELSRLRAYGSSCTSSLSAGGKRSVAPLLAIV